MEKKNFIEDVAENAGLDENECIKVLNSVKDVATEKIKESYNNNKGVYIAAGLILGAKILFGRKK